MERKHIEAYLNRGWADKEAALGRFWAQRKAEMSVGEIFGLLDDLRVQAQRLHPDWPSEAERQADLATHIRVSEALRSVRLDRRR